ncbi:serine/threonine-protein kinase [Limnoglobus roseus]|nr:serine/threonine-protein kinase [Limnoglobus roseus]
MTPGPTCPSRADFEDMMLGRLDDQRAAEVEAHVETCVSCQAALDELHVETHLTAALRGGPVPVAADNLADVVGRLEDMASQFTPAGADLSVSGDGAAVADTVPFDPPSHPEDLGHMGSYRIVQLLGAGGMGLVYLAHDEVLDRNVAVKVLRPRMSRRSSARKGFLKEARAMAALKHDNVVTVFQVGEATGGAGPIPFLAMELLEGESLADWVRREGPLPPEWVARLGAQAALGLAAAHGRGVVHRDIKPGNLWLEAPPEWAARSVQARPPLAAVARVKVLDFGLAQPPQGETDPEVVNAALGTPAYMPPEQAAGAEVDHRADLFSLGVVLYELLTGKRPFPRENRREKAHYPIPAPVTDLAPATPQPLAYLIHRMISADPNDRPATALEVFHELPPAAGLEPESGPHSLLVPKRSLEPARAKGLRRFGWIGGGAIALLLLSWFAINRVSRSLETGEPAPAVPESIPGPPDDAWVREVHKLPNERRILVVVAKLRELNPDYDGKVARYALADGKVREFYLLTDTIADIRPVRALGDLKSLTVVGSEPGKGRLEDLSPIRGLELTILNVWQNARLTDISPAAGMKLVMFQAGDTPIEDLSPLKDMPLTTLAINNCRVRDLSVIPTLRRLNYLRCDGCPAQSLQPLLRSTLSELTFTPNHERGHDSEVLEGMKRLTKINQIPANEFRQKLTPPQ